MANPNPDIDGLKQGRGRRPKEDNETISMRLPSKTLLVLEDIADQYGVYYGDKPWISGLLRKIGEGELMVVPATPDTRQEITRQEIKQRLYDKAARGKLVKARMSRRGMRRN